MKALVTVTARILIGLGLAFASAPGLADPPRPGNDGYVPCKVKQKVDAIYPQRMLAEGILRGEALVVIQVDHTGRLGDTLIVAHTQPAFADAAIAAIKEWKFTPASLGDQALTSRIDITFLFEVTGVVVYEKKPFDAFSRVFDDDRFAYRPYRSVELDTPVKAIHQPGPIYPKEWMVEGRRGVVVIDFFIDETGGVRLAAPVGRGTSG